MFAALIVVIAIRSQIGEVAFKAWGWRIPFMASALLFAVSLWIRLQLNESPVFQKMKDEGTTSKAPLSEAFGKWSSLKRVIVVLIGAIAGQAVVWYAAQFYALLFMEKTLKLDPELGNIFMAIALALGTPFFIFFGWLSDKIGRKPIILAGCLLASIGMFPAFEHLTQAVNPALAKAQLAAPVSVIAQTSACSVQFDPIGKNKFDSQACDVAKSFLAKAGISYSNLEAASSNQTKIKIGAQSIDVPNTGPMNATERKAAIADFQTKAKAALAEAGYPSKADPAALNKPVIIGILFGLIILVTMVYGPIAAMLVEAFPSRIRYSAMSLPYHIGNGWFGGFLPTTAFALVASNGNIYYGLWYPVCVAAACFVIGLFFLPETYKNDIDK